MADQPKKPFHEVVAENLIRQLKEGTAPWQRPWKAGDPAASLPLNPTTGKRYKGINAIHLMSQFRSDPRWMTYKQAAAVGAQVRKGEKSTAIQYWKFSEERVKTDANGKPIFNADGEKMKEVVELERPRVFFAYVFNAEQIDGLPPIQRAVTEEHQWEASARAEKILAASGATITHANGDRAFYRPSTDSITLPEKTQFPTADAYYATAMHELGHWTGHHTRLNRDLAHPFGSEGYAKEELRAEISSMILGVELGLGHDPGQHAAYVKSWIKVLEDDAMEIFRAAAEAEKIQNYVLAFEQQQTQQQTQGEVASAEQPALAQTQRASAFIDIDGKLRDRESADFLPDDWEGLAEGDGNFWYIGREAGERTFTVLAAQNYTDAVTEAEAVKRLALDISTVLTDADSSFDHYESFEGDSLEAALRARALTTVGSVTGSDPAQFFSRAIDRLSPVFGIAPSETETTNAYLERKGLAQAFQLRAEQLLSLTETQEASMGLPEQQPAKSSRPEIKPGRLVDRLQEAGVMSHGDAAVTAARRDFLLATESSRGIDRETMDEESEKHLMFTLPANWTGEVQIKPLAEVNGQVVWADDAGIEPTFHGLYAAEVDGEGAKTYQWLIDYREPQQAQHMADRLEMIDAYSQPNARERDNRLDAIEERRAQRDGRGNSIEAELPATWTGETMMLGLVARDGTVKSAEAEGAHAEFYGIYLATNEDGQQGWTWHKDFDRSSDAAAYNVQLQQLAASRATEGGLSVAPDENRASEKTFINVPFKEKDQAKELGAKWDKPARSWYVPAGVDLNKFERWTQKQQTEAATPPVDQPATQTTAETPAAAQRPDKQAHELSLDDFSTIAQVVKLENHGRQWEVSANGQHAFSDAADAADAIRDVHRAFVSNALYAHDPENAWEEHNGALPPFPPGHVLVEYPELKKKFPDLAERIESAIDGNAAQSVGPVERTGMAAKRDNQRQYLAVPYGEKDLAQAAGAKWDKPAGSWYVGPAGDLEKLQRWLPENVKADQTPSMSPHEEFAEALRAMGCIVSGDHPIMDGQKHRILAEGDKGKNHNVGSGFYVGHLPKNDNEVPAGYIRNNRSGVEIKWKAKGYTLDKEAIAKLDAEAAQKRQERERETTATYAMTAARLANQVKQLSPVTEATPYMVKKGIEPQAGALTDKDGLTIYLPATDAAGKQWSTQYVNSDGSSKRFAKDSRKEGCFHTVGGDGPDALAAAPAIVIGEGYATMCSAKQVLGFPTVAAFDSGNLKPVAVALKERYPDKPIVFLGDNDLHLEQSALKRNPGKVKAQEAAREVGGTAIFPIFAPNEQERDPAGFTDFNDLANKSVLGVEGMQRQVKGYVDDVIEKHQAQKKAQSQTEQQELVQTQQIKRARKVAM